MKRLLFPLLAAVALPTVANSGIVDAEIKGLGWGMGFKEASSSFEIRCGEGESKTVCNVKFLEKEIKINDEYIDKSKILHFWRNHDVWGSGAVTDHIYVKFLNDQGQTRLVKFILINKRDAAEFWNLLNNFEK